MKSVRFPGKFRPLPEGKYPARLVWVESIQVQEQDGWSFRFQIAQGEYRGCEVARFLQLGNVNETLAKWILILAGHKCDYGERFDLDTLVGKECVVSIGQRTKIADIFPLERREGKDEA